MRGFALPEYHYYDLYDHKVNCPAGRGVASGDRSLRSSATALGLTLIIGGAGGFLVDSLGFTGGWLVGAIAATFAASALKAPVMLPNRLRSITMGFAGMTMGAAANYEMAQLAAALPWSLTAMFALLAFMAWLTFDLHRRFWKASRATAVSCAWPGNVLLAFAGAEALKADMDRVAVVQLVRVLTLMGILPLAVGTFQPSAPDPAAPLTLDFAIATMVTLACTALAVRINIVGGELFLTAIAIGGLSAFQLLRFEVPGEGLAVLQVLVGTYIGIGLARCRRQAFLAALIPAIASAILAALMTLAAAFALADMLGYPAAALALAFAPGGAEVMILLSALFDVDPAFVGIHHAVRLIGLSFCFPLIVRFFAEPPHHATGSR